ncbi:MAG: adenylosuccinate synthase [Acholeplasmatales bacterium]|nr:MAG: adenylosuccinate synthase [Acholeplasmatales bacterium]
MHTLTIIGAQWGDEGKGKVTDFLARHAAVTVRFQGGNNAGHTITLNDRRFALHLIPSGVFTPGCLNILGQGMVVNPQAFLEEIAMLKQEGIPTENIVIADRAHVVMPYHRLLDEALEAERIEKVGTTFRGIGPAYSDKAARSGIRMADFIDDNRRQAHIQAWLPHVNRQCKSLDIALIDEQALQASMTTIAKHIRPFVKPVGDVLDTALKQDKKILFEGAQGTMLCLENGTYPFVTSSSPTAAGVPLGAGVPPQAVQNVIGVAKAYTTRVGEGAFPTEFVGDIADQIRHVGREYGTTTGRPRRIGWLDLVVLKHAARTSGITQWAVMLVDVLQGIETLKLCTAYQLDGERIHHVPAAMADYARCEPVYTELPGFQESLEGTQTFQALPEPLKHYLQVIETITGVPVGLISIGPERNQTIRCTPFYQINWED